MVTDLAAAVVSGGTALVLAVAEQAEEAQTLLMRLDPRSRAGVMMALLGLVLVGLGLVAIVILAGRRLVRIARISHGPTRRHDDDWYRKPLVPREGDERQPRDSE